MDEDEIEVEPFYNPATGEQLGWSYWNEEGQQVVMDDYGTALSALDPADGTVWDASRREWTEIAEPAYADPRFAEYDERLAAVEAAEFEPREPVYVPYAPEVDRERQELDLDAQAAHLEARLGRPLLLSEKRALGQQFTEAEIGGEDRIDLPAAVDRLRERGQPLLDLDSGSLHQQREARQQFMAERFADQERHDAAERGEDNLMAEQAPPSQSAFDADDRAERQQYLLERLEGRADPSQLYSTDEYAEAWEEYENQ